MNAHLYLEHITRLWYIYTPAKRDEYRMYLSALRRLYKPSYTDDIDNVEHFLVRHLNLISRIPDTKWSTLVWCVIDTLPVILSMYPTDSVRRDIVTLLTYMPYVAIECERCREHMKHYISIHKIDTHNLSRWIYEFKQSVEDEIIVSTESTSH